MVNRVEYVVAAKNGLKPGLAAAAAELSRFRSQQTKASSAFGSTAARAFAAVGGIYAGGRVIQNLNDATKRFAEVDRAMARTGITGDATVRQTRDGTAELRNLARETATLFDPAQKGLDAITASGRDFGDAMKMMPSVLKTAQASGAGVDDIANSSTALIDHMKISIEGLAEAQDTLAMGGKLGKFELKDMARYLPSMLPAFKALGQSGQDGLRNLVSILQVIRSGTGTAEEAANSAQNIFSKMESDETVKNFKEMGIDLPKAMTKARKEGKDLLKVFLELSNKALKGDLSKLPQLFNDQEVQRGMRPLLTGLQKIVEYNEKLKGAKGTINADFLRISVDAQATLDRFAESSDRAKTALGGLAAEVTSPIVKAAGDRLNELAQAMERATAAARDEGFSGALNSLTKDITKSGEPYTPGAQDDIANAAQAEAATQATNDAAVAARIAERVGFNDLAGRDPKSLSRQEIARLYIGRRRQGAQPGGAAPPLSEDEIKSILRDQQRKLGLDGLPIVDTSGPEFDAARESAREARRAGAFGSSGGAFPGARPGRSKNGAMQPPVRPAGLKGAIDLPVQPLDDVQTKVSAVATSFGLLGPAAQTAGSQIASGVGVGLSEMQQLSALIAKVQQQLNGLRVPNLGGGLGGFNTGRQGPN